VGGAVGSKARASEALDCRGRDGHTSDRDATCAHDVACAHVRGVRRVVSGRLVTRSVVWNKRFMAVVPVPPTRDFDVVVIGGGPAGSSTATRLARRGRSVLVLEREVFPRFHVGESLVPWTDEVFQELGLDGHVAQGSFVEKWGASFTSADGSIEKYADFATAAETPRPQTYQVRRADFDHLLLQHAARSGATVLQETTCLDVTFAPEHVAIRYAGPDGERTVRAAAVVDASGRAGMVSRRLTERRYDELLKNVALHAWYEDVPRSTGRRSGDIRMVTRPDRGWFWLIPVSEQLTSVGVVLPKDVHKERTGSALDMALDRYVRETPAAAALMAGARRVSEVRFDADYSYESSAYAGDRWLVAGDAGAFLDPIFSTGVLLAMQGGIDAADALDAALAAGDVSHARFARFEQRVDKRYRWFRRFATGFYDPAFRDVFFVSDTPFGLRDAVLSVLAGNWRPSLATRLRLMVFFAAVGVHRHVALTPRLGDLESPRAQPLSAPVAGPAE
jgi:flavin-dependent dehydrogenase